MVSAERYLKAFVETIPRRAALMKERTWAKRDADQRLRKNPRQGIGDSVSRLIGIIGKDTLFRHAEKKEKQTLRHYLWKYYKGFKFFNHKTGIVRHKLESNPRGATQVLTILKEVQAYSEELGNDAEALDEIYKKQVKALEKGNVEEYFSRVDNEEYLLKKLSDYAKRVKKRREFILKIIVYYFREVKKSKSAILFMGLLTALLAHFLSIAFTQDSAVLTKVAPILIPLIIGNAGMLLADASISKAIRDYVSETI